jgi:hypothetical protein
MRRTRRIIAAAGILSTAGIASVAAATMAGATTAKCATNGYCYTQEVHNTHLVMSFTGNYAHDGAPVVVEKQSNSSDSDFLAGLAPFPTHSNAKIFEYAPKGKLSGFCVTEAKNDKLVLDYCNGSASQAWDANQVGNTYEWINEATNDAMTDGSSPSNNPGNAGTQLTGQDAHGKKNQLWDAVNS